MDLSRILDGSPEPSSISGGLDFLEPGYLVPQANSPSNDYVLPVPMTPFQKQLTDDIVSLHASDILRFLAGDSLDNEVLQTSLDCLNANTQLVATHPYLLVQHYLPPNLLLKDVHNRLTRASGKFSVLMNLIEIIRDKNLNVALISRAGKSFDLIESLLLGRMINYRRYSGTYLRQPSKSLKKYSTIHLFPSSQLYSTYIGSEKFDLVIAFDLSFSPTDSHIQALRTQSRPSDGPPAPIVRLIPYYSSEHIIYSLQDLKNDDELLYTKRLMAAMVVLRRRVGSVPDELKTNYYLGLKFLLPWLSDPATQAWLVPPVPEIPTYSIQAVEKSLLEEPSVDPKPDTESTDSKNGSLETKEKDSDMSVKKEPGVEREASNTYQSNGTQSSPSVLAYQPFCDSTEKDRYLLSDSKTDDFFPAKRFKLDKYSPSTFFERDNLEPHSELPPGELLTHKILQRLETVSRVHAAKEAEAQVLARVAAQRQTRYEALCDENGALVQRMRQLEEKLQVSERRAERHDAELERAGKELMEQQRELETVRAVSGTPEASVIDAQQIEIEMLESQVGEAEKKAKMRTEEHEHMCGEYQKASTAAKEACEEVVSLKSVNKGLQEQLRSQTNDLCELAFEQERAAKDEKIKVLEAKILGLAEHMKRLMESERFQPTRSRYGVRSSATFSRRNNSPSVNWKCIYLNPTDSV